MPEIKVLDSVMHYEDSAPDDSGISGFPVVFLHGNPGSSHLWRNVLSRMTPGVRTFAPDLIGMGRSGKPDIDYSFADHARYLDAWFDAMGLHNSAVLVGHDWGGALAFDYAARHPGRVYGVAFCESIVKPIDPAELSEQARKRMEMIRTPGEGERFVLEQDQFIRAAYTGGGVLTPVSDADLRTYLAPFPTPESRRPILAWARQFPVGGEPAGLVARIEAYDAWLAASPDVPKLLMTFEGSPTLLINEQVTAWCAANIAALDIVPCGKSAHHAPEDRPVEIAAAITAWTLRHNLS